MTTKYEHGLQGDGFNRGHGLTTAQAFEMGVKASKEGWTTAVNPFGICEVYLRDAWERGWRSNTYGC